MKFSTIPLADAALVFSLLLAPLPTAAMFDCSRIVSDGQLFNLKGLGGPHSVVTSQVDGSRMHNTTYTVDICANLKKKGEDQCPNGSRVCAIKRLIIGDKIDAVDEVSSLAGGVYLDPDITRLSKIDPDSDKKGLRVTLKGGVGSLDKRKKQTVIDFVCDQDLDGTEGEYDPEDKYESKLDRRADDGKNEDEDEDKDKDKGGSSEEVQLGIEKNPSLVFNRYGTSESDTNVDVLQLTWSSKYVCESKAGDGKDGNNEGGDPDGNGDEDGDVKKPSSHWGVFTWIVILVFLGTAAYLIFGSWLNYNRYGARGWDLLPHGDTIRDIPYLLKDWARRVLNTVQGSGSRGGYSAV
ncbi:autophagy-related protein 27 [Hypoxylon argillaceum]|nr:autophagy-related protein 27 [Hypoxylon argillaceum]KAI1152920.1 autophagy-related protein 27 [Nemania diffusa]